MPILCTYIYIFPLVPRKISKWIFAQSPLVVYVSYTIDRQHNNIQSLIVKFVGILRASERCNYWEIRQYMHVYSVYLTAVHSNSIHHIYCGHYISTRNNNRPKYRRKKNEQHLGHLQCTAWRVLTVPTYTWWCMIGLMLSAAVGALFIFFFILVFVFCILSQIDHNVDFFFLLSFAILYGIFRWNICIRSLFHS